jgi:hypothetical protein
VWPPISVTVLVPISRGVMPMWVTSIGMSSFLKFEISGHAILDAASSIAAMVRTIGHGGLSIISGAKYLRVLGRRIQ